MWKKVDQRIIGKSLVKSLAGADKKSYSDSESIGLEVTGNSALFKGYFKIVRNRPPNGQNKWELYNLANDPGETLNLADSMPKKLNELIKDYDVYAEENGVIDLPLEYEWAKEMTTNTFKRNYLPLIYKALFIAALVIAIIIFLRVRRKKSKNSYIEL